MTRPSIFLVAIALVSSAANAQAPLGTNAQESYVRGYLARTENAGALSAALDRIQQAKQGLDNAIGALNGLATDGNLLGRWKTKSVCVDVPSCQTPCKLHRQECGAWAVPRCSTSCSGPFWKVRCSTSCTTPCGRWDQKECIAWWPESCTWSKRCNDVRYFDPTEGTAFKAAKDQAERLFNAARAEYDRKKAELEGAARKAFEDVKKGAEDAIRDTKAALEKLAALAASGMEGAIQTLFEKALEIAGALLDPIMREPATALLGLDGGGQRRLARREANPAAACTLDPVQLVRNSLANGVPAIQQAVKQWKWAAHSPGALVKAHQSGQLQAGKGTFFDRFAIARHKQSMVRVPGGGKTQLRFADWMKNQAKGLKFGKALGVSALGIGLQLASMAGAYLWAPGECKEHFKGSPLAGSAVGGCLTGDCRALGDEAKRVHEQDLLRSFGPEKNSKLITPAYYDCYSEEFLEYSRRGFFDMMIQIAMTPLNVAFIIPYSAGLAAAVTAAMAASTAGVGVAAGTVVGIAVAAALNMAVTFVAEFGYEPYTKAIWPGVQPLFETLIRERLGNRPGPALSPPPGRSDPVAAEALNPYVPVQAGQLRLVTFHKTLLGVDAQGRPQLSAPTDRGASSLFKVQPENDGWFRLLTAHNTLVGIDKAGKFHTSPATDRGESSLFRFESAPKGKVRLVTRHRAIVWVTPQGDVRTASYTDRGAYSELRLGDSTAVAKADCKRSGKPVCAGGRTFDSACSARRAGRTTFTRGECAVAEGDSGGGGALYVVGNDGTLDWNVHDGRAAGAAQWRSPQNKTVGSGWGDFAHVFATGENSVYAIRSNGDLMQYRHVGRSDGTPRWEGPRHVGSGWQIFKTVFPGPGSIIYGIKSDGTLCWYRHTMRTAMAPGWQFPSCRVVGSGWSMFRRAFAGEDGVLYGITADGSLHWQKHLGQSDGTPKWLHPAGRVVGSGWGDFAQVVATSGGHVYAFNPRTREVRWYQHDGRTDGTPRWRGGQVIGTEWRAGRLIGAIESAGARPGAAAPRTTATPARAPSWAATQGFGVHCKGACLASGPGCDIAAVPGQCSFPRARATELCAAHPQCRAVTCNNSRNDCQARDHADLTPLPGFTSFLPGK